MSQYIIQADKVIWTVLIENDNEWPLRELSNTYCFTNKKAAEEFVDRMRVRLYPNYPDSEGEWTVYHALVNRLWDEPMLAAEEFVEKKGLDDE